MHPIAAVLLALALPAVVHAAPITIRFSGVITEIELSDTDALPPISIGDPFQGSYSYDGDLQYTPVSPSSQLYRSYEHRSFSFELMVGGTQFVFSGDPEASRLEVLDAPEGDPYQTDIYYLGLARIDGEDSLAATLQIWGGEVGLSPSGALEDLPLPTLPATGGSLVFAAPPMYLISPSRIVPGLVPGGRPILISGQQYTIFDAVYSDESLFWGQITSLTMPEPGAIALLSVALGLVAIRFSGRACRGPTARC